MAQSLKLLFFRGPCNNFIFFILFFELALKTFNFSLPSLINRVYSHHHTCIFRQLFLYVYISSHHHFCIFSCFQNLSGCAESAGILPNFLVLQAYALLFFKFSSVRDLYCLLVFYLIYWFPVTKMLFVFFPTLFWCGKVCIPPFRSSWTCALYDFLSQQKPSAKPYEDLHIHTCIIYKYIYLYAHILCWDHRSTCNTHVGARIRREKQRCEFLLARCRSTNYVFQCVNFCVFALLLRFWWFSQWVVVSCLMDRMRFWVDSSFPTISCNVWMKIIGLASCSYSLSIS